MTRPVNTPQASSATSGFFQTKPVLPNQYLEDATFKRVMGFFLTKKQEDLVAEGLKSWGERVLSPQVLRWVSSAEAHPPYLVVRDSFGSPLNELVTSEGWRCLQNLGISEGIVALAYEAHTGINCRTAQFLKVFLWSGSSSTVTCPSAMQDGAAALIRRQLKQKAGMTVAQNEALESAYVRLTSRDPNFAWTSGQWMTERSGGSDVSGTETRARLTELTNDTPASVLASDGSALGPWSISGFKWFSSATDANMTVLLAKTDAQDRVSLFFAPTRILQTVGDPATGTGARRLVLNGIIPQRLKKKLGTKALPTAELELEDMRAFILGSEGQGIKEISTVLNITRVYNAVSSVGALGRGLAISRAYAKVRRTAGGVLLMDLPAHVRGMAAHHVKYRGNMMLTYFVVHLLGIAEQENSVEDPLELVASRDKGLQLLRLLAPVAKAVTALAAIDGLRFCMESLGGLGYLENEDIEFNVAKLFRDTNVLSIWEGTTDVMAADAVRVLKGQDGKQVCDALKTWIEDRIGATDIPLPGVRPEYVVQERDRLFTMIRNMELDELLYNGRDILDSLSWIVSSSLLIADAKKDRNELALEFARRWLLGNNSDRKTANQYPSWNYEAIMDRQLVFGPALNTKSRI